MTDKTLELIANFSPQLINIPVNKCELEEVIDTLINLMFPICNCPEDLHVQEGLKLRRTNCMPTSPRFTIDNQPMRRQKLLHFTHRYKNDSTRMLPVICSMILQRRAWRR